MKKDLLNDDEQKALELCGELASIIYKIIGNGPNSKNDTNEAELYIHALQNMLMSQAAARAYPHEYRLLGENIESS